MLLEMRRALTIAGVIAVAVAIAIGVWQTSGGGDSKSSGRKPLRTNDANEVLVVIRNGWGCR